MLQNKDFIIRYFSKTGRVTQLIPVLCMWDHFN